jgi:hypothetical protein
MTQTRLLPIPFLLVVAVSAGLLLGAPRVACAQSGPGIRAGVSADPDQFFFGAHYDTGHLFDRVSFRPNVEVGLGDNVTTVSVNFEFAYWFKMKQPWNVYAGGGPALVVYTHGDQPDQAGHTDTEPGFNLMLGIAHRGGLFAEVKAGLIDSPSVKFTIGYSFR